MYCGKFFVCIKVEQISKSSPSFVDYPIMSENPLQNILTPSQFQQCVQFYEADQKLDHAERVALATQLQTLAMKTSLAGYTTGMLGFSLQRFITVLLGGFLLRCFWCKDRFVVGIGVWDVVGWE